MKMRLADYIPQYLHDYGVRHAFMLSGGGIMHLTDGLACNTNLNTICLHHEQSVSMAVEAYARRTGLFGVGYFTTGPGATNALTGLAGAWLDSVPCLFISGQAKRKETTYLAGIPGLRQIGVQELNVLPIVASVTKYAAFVAKPEDIRYHLEKAIYLAHAGRPGPVWLDIPLDVQGALIETDTLRSFRPTVKKKKFPVGAFQKAVSLLKRAQRPVLVVGQGVRLAGAMDALAALAQRHSIPVVTTFLGVDVMPSAHPQNIGRIGIKGTRPGNLAMQNADLLLIVGTSMPVAQFGYEYDQFAREGKLVVIDIDLSSHRKKAITPDLALECDAREFLERLQKSLKKVKLVMDPRWVPACAGWRKRYPVCLPEYTRSQGKVNVYNFIEKLSRRLQPTDTVVTDAGSAFYAGSQALQLKKGMRYITTGGLLTMGYNLPASIGACFAAHRGRVICITGDGSFQQNIQELQSIVHHDLPIKIFVLNNEGYLSIRVTQEKYFKRFIGESSESGVSFPDLGKVAKAYGLRFVRAGQNQKIDEVLEEVLQGKDPVLCELVIPRNHPIVPSLSSETRPDGSMISKPLEDMYPFLDRKEFRKNMFVRPVEE